jgi:ribosomal protein L11 methyltransferase
MSYTQLSFAVTGTTRDILVAQLSEVGCEGFEETDDILIASFPPNEYDEAAVNSITTELGISYSKAIIEQQNWNALWEADFQPVIIPGFCTVRAGFHPPATDTPYEIIITPKMSFGTGHHATTMLMMAAMKELNFTGSSVLDFGTGTGILAILASKLGAADILAIDNDEWSVENTRENLEANSVYNAIVAQGSLELAADTAPFDVILANINRHILLHYMGQMSSMLKAGGHLLLSGILAADESIISEAADNAGLILKNTDRQGDWLLMKFTA